MLRLAVDEDVNGRVVRGLLRRVPGLDLVRVQDAGLMGARDPQILAWAASNDRVLLTQDANTMTHHAYRRLTDGSGMSGVIVVAQRLPIGDVIEDLVLMAEFSETSEWANQLIFLPL